MDSVSTMDSENMSAWYIQRILQRFLLNTGIQSVTTAAIEAFLVHRFAWLKKWPWCSAN